MNETPRTDAFVREIETSKQDIWQALNSLQGFARHLERELQKVTKERDEARQHIDNVHFKDFGFPPRS